MRERLAGKWDKGYTQSELEEIYKNTIEEAVYYYYHPAEYSEKLKKAKRRSWKKFIKFKMRSRVMNLAVLYLQLKNAARATEAAEGIVRWLQYKEDDPVRVRIRKRKDNERRLIVIPKLLKQDDVLEILKSYPIMDPDILAKRVKWWVVKQLKLNTHTNRYAGITDMLLEGINPVLVASITGHKKIDTLVVYAQKLEADKILMRRA